MRLPDGSLTAPVHTLEAIIHLCSLIGDLHSLNNLCSCRETQPLAEADSAKLDARASPRHFRKQEKRKSLVSIQPLFGAKRKS